MRTTLSLLALTAVAPLAAQSQGPQPGAAGILIWSPIGSSGQVSCARQPS